MVEMTVRFVLPYICFAIGIFVACQLKFYPTTPDKALWIMGGVSGAFIVSVLLMGVRVESDVVTGYVLGQNGLPLLDNVGNIIPMKAHAINYGHEKSVPYYVFFCATITLYGTSAQSLFESLRRRHGSPPAVPREAPRAAGPTAAPK